MHLKPLLLCLFFPLCCGAVKPYVPQQADPMLEPWRWRDMTELGGRGVRCVDEAPDGSLWFGGIAGLLHYDGLKSQWHPFDDDLKSRIDFTLPGDMVCSSILCREDGSLIAVVESALLHWEDGTWAILEEGLGTAEYETRLVRAEDDAIWLLRPNSLRYFNADLSQQQMVVNTLAGERITSFCLDAKGDAWIVRDSTPTESNLIHVPMKNGRPLEEGSWRSYPIAGAYPARETSLCAGPDDTIWYVNSQGGGVARSFNPDTGEWAEVDHPNASIGHFSLFKDRHGTLWAGGAGSLLAIRQSGPVFYEAAKLGLPTVPFTVFESEKGCWWVIIRGGHVFRMDPGRGQWHTYANLHFECESADGTQWFLEQGGRVVSHQPDTDEWQVYTKGNLQIRPIRSLQVSSNGLVFALGRYEGRAAFSVFSGTEWIPYSHPEFAAVFNEQAFLEAADGTIWFGAGGDRLHEPPKAGGVLQYEVNSGKPRLLKQYSSEQFPYAISRISQTPDGRIWLGAPQVYSYWPDRGGNVELVPNLPDTYTHDMVTDVRGDLWIAKGLFGIYRYAEGQWRRFQESDGLKGIIFVDLLPLPDGTMLVASDKGINRFDGEAWAGSVFPADFGMSSRGGSMRRSRDGALWFNFDGRDSRSPRVIVNLDAQQEFCTVRYTSDTQPPETWIEEHLDRIDSQGNIYVSWGGRDSWGNTPLDQLHYSWRIDGGDWSPFTQGTSRMFLGLKSGEHVLEVRARDRDFNIDVTPARSEFSVALPVWLRPWFIAMVLAGVGGTAAFIWILIYYHDKRLKDRAQHLVELDRFKNVFFANISHDLYTPLSSIMMPLKRLAQNARDEDDRKTLSLISLSAERMSSLVGQLLDFARLEQGRMQVDLSEGDIAQVVRNALELQLLSAQIRQLSLDVQGLKTCQGWFDEEKIRKIVENLAGNAIKYTSPGGEVRVKLSEATDGKERRTFQLVVEDTGPGIDPVHLEAIFDRFYRVPDRRLVNGSGIGLNLVKELVELMGGSVYAKSPICTSSDAPGSRFVVSLPLDRRDQEDYRIRNEA